MIELLYRDNLRIPFYKCNFGIIALIQFYDLCTCKIL